MKKYDTIDWSQIPFYLFNGLGWVGMLNLTNVSLNIPTQPTTADVCQECSSFAEVFLSSIPRSTNNFELWYLECWKLFVSHACQYFSIKFLYLWAVVVAQAVEWWHSVRASQVRIPGRTWLFFRKNAINLFLLGVGLYLKKTSHRKCSILFLLLSYFLSFNNCEYINCIVPKK